MLTLSISHGRAGASFGFEAILLTGGAGINGTFLKAGLIDEISVLTHPAVDGLAGVQTIFEYPGGPDGRSGAGQALRHVWGRIASPAKKSRFSRGSASRARVRDRLGKAQLYAPPMEAIRLQDVAASGWRAKATSLLNRAISSVEAQAEPSSSAMRVPSPPRSASITGHPLGRMK
jgi:5-amino-6-(5-phosphoribosylamino)uracil reductase